MNAADIELARMVYIASALGGYLSFSLLLRGLWRPLRFWLLALAMSFFFTPFFLQQKMPDGSEQNIVPAFIVVFHDVAQDRKNWREAMQRGSKPIVTVAGVASLLAFALAILLPKPARKMVAEKKSGKNPYLPEDFQTQ